MARIKNTQIYDYDASPSPEDYLIGTDSQDNLRTRSYLIGDIIALRNSFLGLPDTPNSFEGQSGKTLIVNDDEDGLIFGESASSFLSLLDTPSTFTGQSGKSIIVNDDEDGVVFGEAISKFLSLSDTPSSYVAQAGKSVLVNAQGTGLTFGESTSTFLSLTDTPDDYSFRKGWILKVNDDEDGIDFQQDNYVTLDTVQTVNAAKTFNGVVRTKNIIADDLITANSSVYITGGLRVGKLGSDGLITIYPSTSLQTNSTTTTHSYFSAVGTGSGLEGFTFKPGGIKFSGTLNFDGLSANRIHSFQDRSGTIAYLDDISPQETGTFTATLGDSGGRYSYTQRTSLGSYVKMGKVINFTINIQTLTTSDTGGTAGLLSISGFDFLDGELLEYNQVFTCLFKDQQYHGTINGDGTFIFREIGGSTSLAVLATDLPNNTQLYMTGAIILD
ncbi:tail protein [Cellulophaga phage Calle_1]|uniref:Tail protein n=1 Tax=Cellulophaga phage Calle_1 TaxID=2745643 RepID=A0A8E4ZDS7_9CAUD|nr:tail protein [Cellulophaga phage Calle_1]QQV89715.1 tail protein [Cellulophaga phage Calle_1]QQV89789.1 tail protein [Cellulophaga phage Calle_2]QQV89930.1 tail protein [Cellulophaga phage Calle_3]